MGQLEELRQFHESYSYDCIDIAERLIELSNLDGDDDNLMAELINALYQIEAMAQNPYNADYYRVLYNVLLAITIFESF